MDRDTLIAEIEREHGGSVITTPPVITSSGKWKATIHGGFDVALLSVSEDTEIDALQRLASVLIADRESKRLARQ
jgi:hypothetical protein